MSLPEPVRKTIKLVVSPQYHALGFSSYTAVHNITDPVSVLKTQLNATARPDHLTLLFRGRKISGEDESISFEALMQKYHVSMDEEVLVFHGVVSNDILTNPQWAETDATVISEAQNGVQRSPGGTQYLTDHQVDLSRLNEPIAERHRPAPERAPLEPSEQSTSASPPSVPRLQIPANAPPLQQPTTSLSPSVQVRVPPPPAVPRTIQHVLPPATPDGNIRHNIQVVPIQYQALIVNGLPVLAQLGRLPQIRLSSDHVIPVVTHEGQAAYIVSPAGVAFLAHQGYRVEVRVLPNQPGGARVVRLGGQPQVPPPERRFGLTDLVTLFRRRLGQQLWLMFKLAFMVGIFSSNNASWRRIIGLCIAAALIFFWQTGEFERWAGRFRRPPIPIQGLGHLPDMPVPEPPAEQLARQREQQRDQEGPVAALTAGLRLAEQVLFVFVASLWPNAVGGGIPPEIREDAPPPPPPPPPAEQQRPEGPRRRNMQDGGGEENPNENNNNNNNPGEGENARERINLVVH